jgi:hypothetical protein
MKRRKERGKEGRKWCREREREEGRGEEVYMG